MTYRHNGSQPVYAPNSYGGPQADPSKELPTWWVEAAEIGRYAYWTNVDAELGARVAAGLGHANAADAA